MIPQYFENFWYELAQRYKLKIIIKVIGIQVQEFSTIEDSTYVNSVNMNKLMN